MSKHGPKVQADPERDADSGQDAGLIVEDDALVEEVSIDGMCGVY